MTGAGDHQDWRSCAACLGADPELFFPEGVSGPALRVVARAKSLCRICPVREPCLEWAQTHGPAFGIWGGHTEQEREVLRRAPSGRAERGAR
jgi:WhiB family redox-sensing transcriptional regulator